MEDQPALDEMQRLRDVLDRQQEYAWDALRQALLITDDAEALRPATGGRALRTLLELLSETASIAIDLIDVEVLASGLYEAVMARAGLQPDPRTLDPDFRAYASREFELEPGITLWDEPLLPSSVLQNVRSFSTREVEYIGPNLTHSQSTPD